MSATNPTVPFAPKMTKLDPVKEREKFNPDDFELLFSLCCFALGTGAGSMHMKSNGMEALRLHFKKMMTDGLAVFEWKKVSDAILENFRAVGRLSANLAIDRGSKSIEQQDLAIAVDRIISTIEKKMEDAGLSKPERGGLCTFPAVEQ
jgi:hypothetical protein